MECNDANMALLREMARPFCTLSEEGEKAFFDALYDNLLTMLPPGGWQRLADKLQRKGVKLDD